MFQSKNSHKIDFIHPAVKKLIKSDHWKMISNAYMKSIETAFPRRKQANECYCSDVGRINYRTHYLFPIIYSSLADTERFYETLPFFYIAQSVQTRAINLLELTEIPNYLQIKCYDSFDLLESQFLQIGVPFIVTHKSLDNKNIKFELSKIRRALILSYFDKFDFESSEIHLTTFSKDLDSFSNEFNLQYINFLKEDHKTPFEFLSEKYLPVKIDQEYKIFTLKTWEFNKRQLLEVRG